MSGIFKSAAMSLLSRALQSLLSKYLSDVDVEGVNLPSLYDSEGHSGWGVRLKNVKLRHGVKLRDLPGRPKTSRTKRKRPRPNDTAAATKEEGEESSETSKSILKEEFPKGDVLDSIDPSPGGRSQSISTEPSETTATTTTDAAPAASSSWWFWRSSSVAAEESNAASLSEQEEDVKVTLDSDEDENRQAAGPGDRMDPLVDNPQSFDENDGDDDDDDEHEESDDEIPHILRLGKGGHVGVLDVRLVGSEIHVLVEDGFLIIEAVRVRSNAQADDKMDKESVPQAPRKSSTAASSEPKTVGDRVLAENALARYFSAIPNLLLRDLRIQVVIRDQVVDEDDLDDDESDEVEFSSNDSIVEISVEFLSITDGGDFLGQYRYKDEEDDDEISPLSMHKNASEDRASAHTRAEDRIVENEYMTKRIRTGRGPDGGVVVRIFPPGQLLHESSELHRRTLWARYSWDSAMQYCLLRCSGVDIESRLFVGTKEELASRNYWYTDEYDYDMEFNIFAGVDYVAPAPQPLPPMVRQTAEILEDKFWEYEGAATYHVLDNGIQYSSMKSAFHKVARGMLPNRCSDDHLPCEYCSACWQSTSDLPSKHALDNATPMPGFVLSIITRDPLELNVDRASLEVLGDFVGLLKTPDLVSPSIARRLSNSFADPSMRDVSETEYEEYSERFGRSQRSLQVDQMQFAQGDDESTSSQSYNSDDDDLSSSFPSYMQPEKIQILGMHLSEVRFRVHVMQSDNAWDQGLAFCYWDALAKCVTTDHQRLNSSVKSYSDLRADIGHVVIKEYKGALDKQLISCGLRQRKVDFDEATIETMKTLGEESNRSPWPSTAAALLDMQPPLETLAYEERDRHGIQFRYISTNTPLPNKHLSRSLLHVWLGPSVVNVPWAVKDQITEIIQQARTIVLGPPAPIDSDDEASTDIATDSLMRYKLHLDGGGFTLEPKFYFRLPLTTLAGERSPEAGLFIETILERVNFKFNEPSADNMTPTRSLSLEQLIELPENIRLSILLFLDDLGPLSQALGIKPEANSFLLCNSVNKALVKVAKRSARRRRGRGMDTSTTARPASRRQELMTELLKLDDDSLEQLWRYHKRYDRQSSNSTPKM